MMPSTKTPESRAADLKLNAAKARKRYKVKVNKSRKFEIAGEEELVKDMVVILKLANYTHTQIGMIVGVSRGQVKEYLKDEKVQKKLLSLREALPQAALELGRAFLIEAVTAVVHVMRTEKDSKLVLQAAAELFDRFGIPKLTRSERKMEADSPLDDIGRGGHETIFEKVKTLTPEKQEQAAQLYDMFEEGLKRIVGESEETSDEVVE